MFNIACQWVVFWGNRGRNPISMKFGLFGLTEPENVNILWFNDPSQKIQNYLHSLLYVRIGHVEAFKNGIIELQMSWGVDWYPYCHLDFLIYFFITVRSRQVFTPNDEFLIPMKRRIITKKGYLISKRDQSIMRSHLFSVNAPHFVYIF